MVVYAFNPSTQEAALCTARSRPVHADSPNTQELEQESHCRARPASSTQQNSISNLKEERREERKEEQVGKSKMPDR